MARRNNFTVAVSVGVWMCANKECFAETQWTIMDEKGQIVGATCADHFSEFGVAYITDEGLDKFRDAPSINLTYMAGS